MQLFYIISFLNKSLRKGYVSASGRNFLGKICVAHRGGGSKRNKFYVDFFRRTNAFGYLLKIKSVRWYTGFLGLMIYENGLSNYILLSDNIEVGDKLYFGTSLIINKENSCLKIGSSVPLSYVSLFSLINNIELRAFNGGQLARAAGTSGILISKSANLITVKLKSGWNLTLSSFNICSLGIVSNAIHKFSRIKKAGIMRSRGIRPTVRGVAMNPCDHPHGGGEGRKSPPASHRSPWGWLTKGTSTLRKKHQIIRKNLLKIKAN